MKEFFLNVFTWWNGATAGTRLFTRRHGEKVGTDSLGNTYYRSRQPIPPFGERRWVIYNGVADASHVASRWHGWLHHRTDTVPDEKAHNAREWELDHKPNMTGTTQAYRPDGSVLTPESRPAATGDYEAWSPGG